MQSNVGQEKEKERVSFNPSLLTLKAPEDGQPHLLGSRCSSCGKVYFPPQELCTQCFQEGSMKEQALSTRGKIYSFTFVERESLAPPGFKVPFAYGYVDLPEGVRIISKIIGWTPETLRVDAPAELVLEEIREDSEGKKVTGYRFKVIV